MSDFYHQYIRFENKYKDEDIERGIVHTYVVNPNDVDHSKFLYLTGSSSNHFKINLCMLLQLFYVDISASIVFFNFGLKLDEVKLIFKLFNTIHQLRGDRYSGVFYYREINWKENPSFLKKQNKFSIISLKGIAPINVAEECQCTVFWLDAGDLVGDKFPSLYDDVVQYGVRSSQSAGPMTKYIHKGMFDYFKDKLPVIYNKKQMCSSGFMGIDYNNENGYKNVGLMMRECCYRERCVLPKGSNLTNHRQEQSALSLLVHTYNVTGACNIYYSNNPKIVTFHNDKMIKQNLFEPFLVNTTKKIGHKYNISDFSRVIMDLLQF